MNFEDCKTSIIIPVLNRSALVLRTLESILGQETNPLEVIVVDNGSTDNTVQSVSNWIDRHPLLPFKITLISEKKPGAAAARNAGARIACGKILMFFDSDDTMRPDCVKTITQMFASHPQIELVYWKKEIQENDGKKTIRTRWSKNHSAEMQVYHAIFSTACMAMRKDLFARAGGWNENLPCWDDLDLGLRLMLNVKSKWNIAAINRVLVDVYPQQLSITGTEFYSRNGCWEKSLDALRLSAHMVSTKKRKKFLWSVDLKETVLIAQYHKEGHEANGIFENLISRTGISRREKIILKIAYTYAKNFKRGTFAIFGRLFQ